MTVGTMSQIEVAGTRDARPWSKSRLSAAVAATRPTRAWASIDAPLDDETEFFAATGRRHHVPRNTRLVQRGERVRDVHLVEQGVVAVVGDLQQRRPILAFTLPDELCCPVPALLREPPPWDAITVTDVSVITVPAGSFTAAVAERWADRWGTRTLSWLAVIGTRLADLEPGDLNGQVAALLLRLRGEPPPELDRRTIADLLDADKQAVGQVLSAFERSGAIALSGGQITIVRAELLRSAVAAVRGRRDAKR